MAYLFDTDAISEVLRKAPAQGYLDWLGEVAREDQFASAVSVGELYRGAFRSRERERHLDKLDNLVLPSITVLPYDAAVAREYGSIAARLEASGRRLADADLQIAATAVHHGLELVTGNLKHFDRVPGLRIEKVLASTRGRGSS